ncbi:MAG: extracellular solute-binding protein [Lachnospiraceae bacterium]|nr:extracellular solute-binding protein [Lachnospiraceae bacterium]
MNKRVLTVILLFILFLTSCKSEVAGTDHMKGASVSEDLHDSFDAEKMKKKMVEAAYKLERSDNFSVKNPLTVTALGVSPRNNATKDASDTYLYPAIEAMTGIKFSVDWKKEADYPTAVATTILANRASFPDLISPRGFGIMDLADDGLIVPLDDYLYLMPDIVAAIGEDYIDSWRSADGHIYTIPSVSELKRGFASLIRKDWLDLLGMDIPDSWDEWVEYWRAVKENDMNHNGSKNDEIPIAFASGVNGERTLVPLLNAFGIRVSDDAQFCILDDGTYTLVYEHPRYDAFLREMAKLYEEGILVKGYESFSSTDVERMMEENILGSSMTYLATGSLAIKLREKGISDALWVTTKPIPGIYGNRLIPEKVTISPSWCVTAAAARRNKVESIVELFNWCFTQEGARLLNYGIEGISYELIDGKPVLNEELVANGFDDVLKVGIYNEPFGGLWLEDEYLQCMFSGKEKSEFTPIQEEIYKGFYEMNDNYYYTMPDTIETDIYVAKRTELLTKGMCALRDEAIRGDISIEDFWNGYIYYYHHGLRELGKEAFEYYNRMYKTSRKGK